MPHLSEWLHDMVDRLHAKPANQPLTGKEADQVAQAAFSLGLYTASEASALVADAKAGKLDAKRCIERVMAAAAKAKGCHGSYACGRPLTLAAQGKKSCEKCWSWIKEDVPHLECFTCSYNMCPSCAVK